MKENNFNENQNLTQDESLRQMRQEMETSHSMSANIPSPSSASLQEAQDTPALSGLQFEQYSNMTIRITEEINNYLGDFFNSLKPLNISFAQQADVYYGNARRIAQNAENRQLSEQEFEEVAKNILTGLMINGVGTLLSTIKTQAALEDVKVILRNDAKDKLSSIETILKNIDDVINISEEQFLMAANMKPYDPNDILEKFNVFRLNLYCRNLACFLDATYKAALDNCFQDEYPFPDTFIINQNLFTWLFDLNEKHSSDQAIIEYQRKGINGIIESITKSIKNGTQPTVPEMLLAKDPGLMAVAIHNYNPIETIGYDNEGDPIGVDDDNLEPLCGSYLRNFYDLYILACEHENSSPIAKSLQDNKSLEEACTHILQLYIIPKDYQKRMFVININMFLGGILAFLVSMMYGLAWYWSLLIGVIGLVIMSWLSPTSSVTYKFMKKLNYVERAIIVRMKYKAGYSETVDLQQIEDNNRTSWIFGAIGFFIGAIAGPIGAIVGLLIGLRVSSALKEHDDEKTAYDYENVHTGKPWKGYIMTTILVMAITLTIFAWIG